MAMLKTIGSAVVGMVVAFAVVFAVERLGHMVYPLPEDLDLRDPQDVAQMLSSIPLAAKLIVVLAWFAGALAGGAAAKRIGRRWWAAWPVAGLVALGGIATIMMIPHPVWMQIAAVAAPLLGGLAASHLVGPRHHAKGAGDAKI